MEDKENRNDRAWLDEILKDSQSDAPEEALSMEELSGVGEVPPEEPVAAFPADDIFPVDLEDILAESKALDEPAPSLEETQFYDPAQLSEDAEAAPADMEPIEKEEDPMPVSHSRPKKQRSVRWFGIPQLVITVIWLAVIALAGATVGRTAWVYCSDLMAFGKPDREVVIEITEDDDIDSIAKKLSDAELIRYPDLFKTFANLTKKTARICVGTFTLNSKYDYNAMINAMIIHSSRTEVDVTIPEGYTCAQIFALLEEKGICSAADLEDYAINGELGDYWFLTGVTRNNRYCLEGYLFPDTYRFYLNEKPANVYAKMLSNFDNRFTDLMHERLATINTTFETMLRSHGYGDDYVASHKITIREVVIIASMIERESANVEESHIIASVIYNRLANAGNYPYLNIDATLVYALGGKQDLTDQDKQYDSPYNTYLYKGLIPGPISNPGRDSLNAALDPDDSAYYFYALNPATNRHVFSKTYEEHQSVLASFR